ncbi:DASH complex subunit Spc19 [Pyronema domesticum]|uniref:DASH complex subunit SPC19 n=1 Tax=Pyronema omphalodes (strain CBS 100304) TaxID=1076935 RepID=U4KZ61_PYROM|nr:DASH complex subunit Spc19 [Pyronema domesticum]CCX04934.1 Similar to DASH complex subunit spc19; acc. no. Q50HP3 [Pyronema omphalodes CBS 100304]
MSSSNNSLALCVQSLQKCTSLLDSSIDIIDNGVRDFPRTAKVIQVSRYFECISEPALFEAQTALHDEIGPEVEHLLKRAEDYITKLDRREKGLISKAELQEGRIRQYQRDKPAPMPIDDDGKQERQEKMKALKIKRERLQHTIDRLSLQVVHKERQLRMRMNYGQK